MPIRYKNEDLLIPMRIWVTKDDEDFIVNKKNASTPKFRLELPSTELTTNVHWFYDDKISSRPEWKLLHTLFVFNVNCFPPVPKGGLLFNLLHNDKPPYNTLSVFVGSFVMSNIDQFFVYTYAVENTIPIFFWSTLDMMNNSTTTMLVNPSTKNDAPLQKEISNYHTRVLMYPFVTKFNYWKATNQNICVPCSKTNSKYLTLSECQQNYGKNMKNRHVWVEDLNQELANYMKWWGRQLSDVKIRSLTTRVSIL